jgi:GrpB-like predicted nucleotidyltransferase (UPF0157 family)
MSVRVVAHDPGWKSEFEAEADKISGALGDLVVTLHHIGSTAIPKILAKPVIDVLLEVDGIVRLDDKSSAMEQLGYEVMGEFGIPGRRYFRRDNASGIRTHQVHAFQKDSPQIERHLAFRDYLIAHPAEARTYGELKRRLAREHPDDMEAYMDGKAPFIKEHEAKALAWWSSQRAKEPSQQSGL